MARRGGGAGAAGTDRTEISNAIAIMHPRIIGTALERGLRAVTRGARVAETLKADVVISAGGGTCAFQLHTNFSHGHVAEAVSRARGLAAGFERCYVLLARPNTDALRNFQASRRAERTHSHLQLSPACDARVLLLPSEELLVPEIQRVSEGVFKATAGGQRREYYKQASRDGKQLFLHQKLRLDQPHRGILAELLRGLGVPDWRQEADLLLDAFGSIRCLFALLLLL
ncbi:unnamed protein product, partial [Ectocarpus fasciculatus]